MNAQEALVLVRIVRAACPGQKLDEYTIDVWADALRDVDFTQAREAVRRLVQRQPFISVSEIVTDVYRARREATRRVVDAQTFRQIEAAKNEHDRDTAHAGYLEASRMLAARLAELHPDDSLVVS